MNAVEKKKIITALKYTWPFYLISAIAIPLIMNVVFGVTHKVPGYKSLTIFVSGEVTDTNKLRNDMLETYKEKELKTFSCISAKPTDSTYDTKLSVPGYNTSDILIMPASKLNSVKVSAFALNLSDELINSYYAGYSLFAQEEVNYGIKIDKEKVKEYMTLPDEECYLILNGKSVNLGEYSIKQPVKEHDTALNVVKDWGM